MAQGKMTIQLLKSDFPKIFIPWEVHCDIVEIVSLETREIGWIGEVEHDVENNVHTITKVTVPIQQVHGATTEIESDGILDIQENEPDFDLTKWRYWGHSHPGISVEPSGQDEKQMIDFAETCDYFIGTIHNKKGDIYGYAIDNVNGGLFIKNIEVIIEPVPRTSSRDWKKIIKDRISTLSEWGKGKRHHQSVTERYSTTMMTTGGGPNSTYYNKLGEAIKRHLPAGDHNARKDKRSKKK